MTKFINNADESESVSLYANIRQDELNKQRWSRDKSAALAANEGISLSDEHWAVINYLRKRYVESGLPRYARTTSRALNHHFSSQGGSKHLFTLFAGGPVTQGSRLANLRTPAGAIDGSFGTNY
jgi:tRNA 2-thiouridine synthesizing protein E